MFASLLVLGSVAYAQDCDERLNVAGGPNAGTNPGCNNAGKCFDGACYCCNYDATTLQPEIYDPPDPDCPGWMGGLYTGTSCGDLRRYHAVRFKYYFPPSSSFSCDQSSVRAQILAALTTFYTDRGYGGILVEQEVDLACQECTSTNVCRFTDLSNASKTNSHTTGIQFQVGTDLHTYYSHSCARPPNVDPLPNVYNPNTCPQNYDFGYISGLTFERVREYNPQEPDAWNGPGTADMLYLNAQLSLGVTESDYDLLAGVVKESLRTLPPTPAPSPVPTTPEPSPTPTEVPTPADTCFELGYTNKLEDLKYMGNGASCRGGIKPEWPGGQTCDSPYIVCLPIANTPNQAPKNPFYDDTHMYTVDQCTFECAWDQRCRGFEFNAKNGGNTGDCILIDDLPLEIVDTDPPGSYAYNAADADLEQYGSLCFQKEDYCNPFFEASDLDQTMLDCYCPNNRKGFYTKKVKREVANYKFCENDADVDERIKQAGANRMWHLCENWCLFNTFTPEEESWYWNPWNKCWREQYAGVGMHRSYCNRVIRNPDTIEQYFINYRTNNFCDPFEVPPDNTPSLGAPTWYLAEEEQSCDEACASRGLECDEAGTKIPMPEFSDMDAAFAEAGHTCVGYGTAPVGFASPHVRVKDGKCARRNTATEDNTGCNWAVGVGYKRLCACAPVVDG